VKRIEGGGGVKKTMEVKQGQSVGGVCDGGVKGGVKKGRERGGEAWREGKGERLSRLGGESRGEGGGSEGGGTVQGEVEKGEGEVEVGEDGEWGGGSWGGELGGGGGENEWEGKVEEGRKRRREGEKGARR